MKNMMMVLAVALVVGVCSGSAFASGSTIQTANGVISVSETGAVTGVQGWGDNNCQPVVQCGSCRSICDIPIGNGGYNCRGERTCNAVSCNGGHTSWDESC